MMHRTIAVIGHVDHGKTSLVNALTGTDTDTLKEEKERGLSIMLGFAHMRQKAGHLHLIDTPGHADFVRMTASGISTADAILLVISAVEGVQAQTVEHVKLAQMLGLREATIALTKSDLASPGQLVAARGKVDALLRAHGFAGAETFACSSADGAGLDNLSAALAAPLGSSAQPTVLKDFFLPVDRVFSASGVGTIITGTLRGAAIRVNDTVRLQPKHQSAIIRGIQIAGVSQMQATPGARVALNLRGVDASAIHKGDVLCAPDTYEAADRFDVRLTPCSGLKHMEQVTVLHGTAHSAARLRLYPGSDSDSVYGQLDFKTAQVAYPGQCFALRRPASAELLTGGVVLDPNGSLITRNKQAHVNVLRACASGNLNETAHALADRDGGVVDLRLLRRTGREDAALPATEFETVSSMRALRKEEIDALAAKLMNELSDLHTARPCRPFIDRKEIIEKLRPAPSSLVEAVIERLVTTDRIRVRENGIAVSDRDPIEAMTADQIAAYHAAKERLRDMGLHPVALFDAPGQEELDLEELLVWKSRAIRLYNHSLKQTILLSIDTVLDARQQLMRAFSANEKFTTGAARQALKTNRKTIVPLLEHFDRLGVTQRVGDHRIVQYEDTLNLE